MVTGGTDVGGTGAGVMGFTGRAGGVSRAPFDSLNLGDHVEDDPAAVERNRELVADRVGAPVRYMRQIHGAEVAVVHRPGPPPTADALVTDTPGLGLAVLVADCVPVLLRAPGAVGVVHAGRRGLADGVLLAAVSALCGLRAAGADRIEALLGPSICAACYEVPDRMRDEVEAAAPGSAAVSRTGTAAIDLRAGLAAQLAELGVTRVTVDPRCTAEDPDLYSFRRDGRTGRFAGFVTL